MITKEEFDAICNKINEEHHGEGGFRRLSNSDWIFAEKLTRLHQYIFLKLTKGMAAKCRVDDQNGFEMWRKLQKAVGHAHPEEGRQMITKMRSLFTGQSTSTEELWKKIMAQDKLNAEHLDKVGRYAPEADMVSKVWFGMTAELAREAARAEVEQEGCSYKQFKDLIEQSREFDRRFAKRKLDTNVEMGISAAGPGNGPISFDEMISIWF